MVLLIAKKVFLNDAFFASENIKFVVVLSVISIRLALSPGESTYIAGVSLDRCKGLELLSDFRFTSLVDVPELYKWRIFVESGEKVRSVLRPLESFDLSVLT